MQPTPPPRQLGPFTLIEPIGRGGMAEVWRGEHRAEGVPVAVKILTDAQARDALFRERFRNEVRAAAQLHHPGIAMVLDHGEIPPELSRRMGGSPCAGSPYLVMEFAPGGTLSDAPPPQSWRVLKRLLLGLLDALAHAHARGVIHRDLTPGNVLLTGESGEGWVKLTDFGIAQAFDENLETLGTRETHTLGTPAYMAPEQITGQWREQGPWTDLYALGCLAYQLVTGRPPFVGADAQSLLRAHMYAPLPTLAHAHLPLPERFQGWLHTLLCKAPHGRFHRAADAACALRSLTLPEDEAERRSSPQNPRVTMNFDNLTRDIAPPSEAAIAELAAALSEGGGGLPATADTPEQTWPRPTLPRSWRALSRAVDAPRRLPGAGLSLFGLRSIPLVGREPARDTLWEALAEVCEGESARAVIIEGAAGTGKSRLARWLYEFGHELGVLAFMRAPHSPTRVGGLPRMLTREFRCAGLPRDAALERITRELERVALPDARDAAVGLAELMFGASSASSADATAAARARHRAQPTERHLLVHRVLSAFARERPQLVLVDDAQWAQNTLDFVRFSLEHDSDTPALFLILVRSELLSECPAERATLETLGARDDVRRLTLEPLSRSEQRALTSHILGLDDALARQVENRASGNPLFAVQLVGDWIQRGVLRATPEGFALERGCAPSIPRTVQQLWERRLRRITEQLAQPTQATTTLEVAALLGVDIDQQEWERACRIAGLDIPDDLLDRLAAQGLAQLHEGGWAFAHEMLRETLEASARNHGRLVEHHDACAQMLRDSPAGDPALQDRLGHHLRGARSHREAAQALLVAAHGYMRRNEYERCYALLERREATLREAELPEQDPLWIDGWTLEALAAASQGQVDRATLRLAAVERLLAGASTAQCAAAAYSQGQLALQMREQDVGARALQRARAFYETLGDERGVANTLIGLGVICRWRGELERSLEHFAGALERFEAAGDAEGTGRCLNGLSATLHRLERFDEAAEALHRAFACHVTVGNRTGQAECLNNLGEEARIQGDFERARELYAQALALLEEVGSQETGIYKLNLGLILMAQRDFVGAESLVQEVLEVYEAQGRRALVSEIYANLLPCVAARQDWGAWSRYLERATALEPNEDFVSEDVAWTSELAAEITLESGHLEQSRQALKLARDHWQRLGRSARVAAIDEALAQRTIEGLDSPSRA